MNILKSLVFCFGLIAPSVYAQSFSNPLKDFWSHQGPHWSGPSASAYASASANAGHASAWASASASGGGASASANASATSGGRGSSASASATASASGGHASAHAEAHASSGHDTSWNPDFPQDPEDGDARPHEEASHSSSVSTCVNGTCNVWHTLPSPEAPQLNTCESATVSRWDGHFLSQGDDLAQAFLSDENQCAQSCTQRSDCSGATFHKPSRTCYLKSWSHERVAYAGSDWTAFIKTPHNFSRSSGAYLASGADMQILQASSSQSCEASCSCAGACVAYTFNELNQICYLKAAGANLQAYPSQNWTSGVKN